MDLTRTGVDEEQEELRNGFGHAAAAGEKGMEEGRVSSRFMCSAGMWRGVSLLDGRRGRSCGMKGRKGL